MYPYTKFEVSSFTRSRFTEGCLKFNFWSLEPNYALFGVFCHAWDGTCQVLSVYRIWSFQLHPFQIYGFIKFENLTLDPEPLFKVLCHSWDGTCQDLSVHRIWSFYSFTRSRFTEGGFKFNFLSLDPITAFLGFFDRCVLTVRYANVA